MSKRLAGIIPIMAAPFTKAGALDEDGFQALVRHLLSVGVNGLTLFGIATEFYKLSDWLSSSMHRRKRVCASHWKCS